MQYIEQRAQIRTYHSIREGDKFTSSIPNQNLAIPQLILVEDAFLTYSLRTWLVDSSNCQQIQLWRKVCICTDINFSSRQKLIHRYPFFKQCKLVTELIKVSPRKRKYFQDQILEGTIQHKSVLTPADCFSGEREATEKCLPPCPM